MHLRVTCDANIDSGVGEIVDEISGPLRRHFVPKEYGAGLLGIVVVLMCRDSELVFERRIRFARQEKKLYMDVMLNFENMRANSSASRKSVIAGRIIGEIRAVVEELKIEQFELNGFLSELNSWFDQYGVVPAADTFR